MVTHKSATSAAISVPLSPDVLLLLKERAAAEQVTEGELVSALVSSFLLGPSWIHDAIRSGQDQARVGQMVDFDDVEAELRGAIAERRRARAR
jgi:predicted transcriptional regulator